MLLINFPFERKDKSSEFLKLRAFFINFKTLTFIKMLFFSHLKIKIDRIRRTTYCAALINCRVLHYVIYIGIMNSN